MTTRPRTGALLVLAHGSPQSAQAGVVLGLARAVSRQLGGTPFAVAALPPAAPLPEQALTSLLAMGLSAEQVAAVPLFLLPGSHAEEDAPQLLDPLGVRRTAAPHASSWLLPVLRRRVAAGERRLRTASGAPVVLVAGGSSRPVTWEALQSFAHLWAVIDDRSVVPSVLGGIGTTVAQALTTASSAARPLAVRPLAVRPSAGSTQPPPAIVVVPLLLARGVLFDRLIEQVRAWELTSGASAVVTPALGATPELTATVAALASGPVAE